VLASAEKESSEFFRGALSRKKRAIWVRRHITATTRWAKSIAIRNRRGKGGKTGRRADHPLIQRGSGRYGRGGVERVDGSVKPVGRKFDVIVGRATG